MRSVATFSVDEDDIQAFVYACAVKGNRLHAAHLRATAAACLEQSRYTFGFHTVAVHRGSVTYLTIELALQ